MNIAIVGTGYVGLTTGACFSEMGLRVICVDNDNSKIENLNRGIIPIYEPGLEEIVKRNRENGRLTFSNSLSSCIDECEVVFIAVGTPQLPSGQADLSQVFSVAEELGKSIKKYTLIVTKSTVPVGTSNLIRDIIYKQLAKRGLEIPFEMASNPEFLKEGAAIKDFMSPDRVVVGVESPKGRDLMEKIYKPFLLSHYRIIFMDILSSEMTKYASNSMLATRISFMNEIARLCELTGADVDRVRAGMGSDARIGNKFLYPGCGYGGSCFPKDVQALINSAKEKGYDMKIIKAVEEVNNEQKKVVFEKLSIAFNGDLNGKTVAILGLSFKPETNDMRQAPSVTTIELLLDKGAKVKVYDPIAIKECRDNYFSERVFYASNIYECVEDADAMAVITEWKEFRLPDWKRIKNLMRGDIVVDGRNIYSPNDITLLGLKYYGIGR